MASTALGSSYVLTEQGIDDLLEIVDGSSAPVSTPGFVTRRPVDVIDLNERLLALQNRVSPAADPR